MSAARVLKVCSLSYSVVPTIWRGPPLTTQDWCTYIYIYIKFRATSMTKKLEVSHRSWRVARLVRPESLGFC